MFFAFILSNELLHFDGIKCVFMVSPQTDQLKVKCKSSGSIK